MNGDVRTLRIGHGLSGVHIDVDGRCRRVVSESGFIATSGMGGTFLNLRCHYRALVGICSRDHSRVRGRCGTNVGSLDACAGCEVKYTCINRFLRARCRIGSVTLGRLSLPFVASCRAFLEASGRLGVGSTVIFIHGLHTVMFHTVSGR